MDELKRKTTKIPKIDKISKIWTDLPGNFGLHQYLTSNQRRMLESGAQSAGLPVVLAESRCSSETQLSSYQNPPEALETATPL